jgi:hypothetical protein
MAQRKASLLIAIFLALVGGTWISIYVHSRLQTVKAHTLEFPMLLAGPSGEGPLQLLPKGTTLYYDQSYPEGFTRYNSCGC